ncbi:hypothetical protein [Streptomyces sp. NBRC 109706]|uniref:hypothetical protein n=1 Tax=Streptomyces sp. NBRC 109706 TaxID=1550035 RepID=UPI000783DA1D|nr:hypothetical protein [Streptomyces sp. NBRC 109706]
MSHPWWTRYQFGGVWRVAAPSAEIFAVLDEPEGYPHWWPQIRAVRRTGVDHGLVTIRSVLPFELRVGVRRGRCDPATGRLEVLLSGDLEGALRWSLFPDGRRTLVVHAQDCVLTAAVPLRFGPPARPVLRANHAAMTRSGERGLRACLEGDLDVG